MQWGKLRIKLGNAAIALSDLPSMEQLKSRPWHSLLAAQMTEGLRIFKVAGITQAKVTAAHPAPTPYILRLPTTLFRFIAVKMLVMDSQARSSMWDYLKLDRRTEIDALQNAILSLAALSGRQASLNTRTHDLIKAAETGGNGPLGLPPKDIRP